MNFKYFITAATVFSLIFGAATLEHASFISGVCAGCAAIITYEIWRDES